MDDLLNQKDEFLNQTITVYGRTAGYCMDNGFFGAVCWITGLANLDKTKKVNLLNRGSEKLEGIRVGEIYEITGIWKKITIKNTDQYGLEIIELTKK